MNTPQDSTEGIVDEYCKRFRGGTTLKPETLKMALTQLAEEVREEEREKVRKWVKKNRGIADSAKYWVKLNDKLSHNQFVLRDKVGKDTITQIALEATDAKLDDLLTQLNNKDI